MHAVYPTNLILPHLIILLWCLVRIADYGATKLQEFFSRILLWSWRKFVCRMSFQFIPGILGGVGFDPLYANMNIKVWFLNRSLFVHLRWTVTKTNIKKKLSTWALYHEDMWGSGGIASPFLTSALDGGEWSASDGGSTCPRNIDNFLPDCLLSHPEDSALRLSRYSVQWSPLLVSVRNIVTCRPIA
jgi:hypothetical protein